MSEIVNLGFQDIQRGAYVRNEDGSTSLQVTPGISGTDFNLNEVGGATITLGQKVAASSLPVVLPALQQNALSFPAYLYKTAIADTQIKATAGTLHTVSIFPTGSVVAGTLTVYDSASETGTIIFAVALPSTTFTPFTVTFDVATTTGIYLGFDGTLANVQATVSYV